MFDSTATVAPDRPNLKFTAPHSVPFVLGTAVFRGSRLTA